MAKVYIKKLFFLTIILFLFLHFSSASFSETDTPTLTPTPTPDTSALQQQISQYEQKIADLQGQEKTFSSQIELMDSQIKLTEYQIESTKEQITSITLDIDTASKKITTLQSALNNSISVLLNRIVATYEVGTIQPLQILLTSGSASDFFTRLNYLKLAQAHDKKLIYDTQQAKMDYANQKTIFEDKKKKILVLQVQLQAQSDKLDQEKQAKQDLLAQTQGSEANYQSLLAQAKAQLAGFSRFVTNQGGATLLSGQTSCDGWGCYYNQRDSQWGSIAINGQGSYSMAGYGCLITSVAMVASHMGHKEIMPSDIALSSGSNFAVDTAMLRYTITVKGVNISRNGTSSIDSALNSGPVIVGIYAYGGTHFVVLKSGSNGNYIMNDPFISGGHDISFTDHYSLNSIFERDTVSI